MIESGRLKAQKIGREYAINPSDLKAVQNRKAGRPRKAHKITKRYFKGTSKRKREHVN